MVLLALAWDPGTVISDNEADLDTDLVHDDAVGVSNTTTGAEHGGLILLGHDTLAPAYLVSITDTDNDDEEW